MSATFITNEGLRRGLYRFSQSSLSVVGAVIVAFLLVLAALGPAVVPFPDHVQGAVATALRFQTPSAAHWFGTNELGQDVFSLTVAATRVSLFAGLAVVLIGTLVGTTIGGIAGFVGGWVDEALMRFTDLMITIPSLIMAMAVAAALGPGLLNMVVAISLSWWPGYARLVRGEVLARKEETYVLAARALGASAPRLLLRHVMPNIVSPIIVKMSLDMGFAILTVAALGFIGIGVRPPLPEWGMLLANARNYMPDFWWTAIFPGLAIFLAVYGFNLLGDGLRDVLDPEGAAVVPLLEIRDLHLAMRSFEGEAHVLNGISLAIERGEVWGLVGETGCGKSLTGLSVSRLVPRPPGRFLRGEVRFDGQDILPLPEREVRALRGRRIGMIFQDPTTNLNPAFRVATQMMDVARHAGAQNRAEARARSIAMLDRVGIDDAARRVDDFPHQFSGGMRQRVLIAMALLGKPDLLVADEPTTALDVSVQAQILRLLHGLVEEDGLAVLLITHNLGVVAQLCSHVAVMYAGNVVETAPVRAIFRHPRHPYTRALLEALPSAEAARGALRSLAGAVPNLFTPPPGCRFAPRCNRATPACEAAAPALVEGADAHAVACLHPC